MGVRALKPPPTINVAAALISNLSYRATNAEAENIEREIEQPSNGVGAAYRPPPRTKEVQVLVVWANKVVYP